jgi:hypothetical protein
MAPHNKHAPPGSNRILGERCLKERALVPSAQSRCKVTPAPRPDPFIRWGGSRDGLVGVNAALLRLGRMGFGSLDGLSPCSHSH